MAGGGCSRTAHLSATYRPSVTSTGSKDVYSIPLIIGIEYVASRGTVSLDELKVFERAAGVEKHDGLVGLYLA